MIDGTLTLAHPLLLALLPLPLLAWWLLPAHGEPRRGLVVPFLDRLADISGREPTPGASISRGTVVRTLVILVCWALVVLALARPQIIEPPITKQVPVRDMLLAVDLSGSMETVDFADDQGNAVDRLSAVKTVLDDFLARRQGDRVGLIFFGSAAFVQAPFTEDLDVVRQLLDEAQVRMAGPQTALGDALGLAINVFDQSTVDERVLIALTDGNDTTSQVPPQKAARIAGDKGIVIHTVAVGDPQAAGEDALDETTLRRVATTTGGLYSHASDRDELENVYDQLDAMETRKADTISHRPRRDIYWWPLAAALSLSMLFFVAKLLRRGLANRANHPLAAAGAALVAPFLLGATEPGNLLAFHFIRPGWLLALAPAALLLWLIRLSSDSAYGWRGLIAPHLLEHLLGGTGRRSGISPLTWIAMTWLAAIIAIAGPSWKLEPSPFADDSAALAFVLRVSPSMETEDIQPSRLERATQKIHDLLAARGNAKSALIAYAGSAHVVMPATNDGEIIDTFARALEPEVMPRAGDDAAAALQLADKVLADAGGGSIVWIADGVDAEQASALADWRAQSNTTVHLWPPLLPGDELEALRGNARPANAQVVQLAADDSDVEELAREADFVPVQAQGADSRWAESGYWLTPLLAFLALLFFRRGWMVALARGAT